MSHTNCFIIDNKKQEHNCMTSSIKFLIIQFSYNWYVATFFQIQRV